MPAAQVVSLSYNSSVQVETEACFCGALSPCLCSLFIFLFQWGQKRPSFFLSDFFVFFLTHSKGSNDSYGWWKPQGKVCLCAAAKNTFYKALGLLMAPAQLSGGAMQGTHDNDLPSLLLYLWHPESSLPCLYHTHTAPGYYPLVPHIVCFCTCAWGWYP